MSGALVGCPNTHPTINLSGEHSEPNRGYFISHSGGIDVTSLSSSQERSLVRPPLQVRFEDGHP